MFVAVELATKETLHAGFIYRPEDTATAVTHGLDSLC